MNLIKVKIVDVVPNCIGDEKRVVERFDHYINVDKIQTIVPHSKPKYYTIIFENGEFITVWDELVYFLDYFTISGL